MAQRLRFKYVKARKIHRQINKHATGDYYFIGRDCWNTLLIWYIQMKNLFYRWHTAFLFQYNIDPLLDKALMDCLDRGIKNIISASEYKITVEFNDGTKYQFKNYNMYDSWLSDGNFSFATGLIYKYENKRPSVKTMFLFKKALENYNFCPVNNDITEEPFLKNQKQ